MNAEKKVAKSVHQARKVSLNQLFLATFEPDYIIFTVTFHSKTYSSQFIFNRRQGLNSNNSARTTNLDWNRIQTTTRLDRRLLRVLLIRAETFQI